MSKRTLLRCANSRVYGGDISCREDHPLSLDRHGTISLKRLIRGEELCIATCQLCGDFDDQGPLVPKEQRGWRPNEYEKDLVRDIPRSHKKKVIGTGPDQA